MSLDTLPEPDWQMPICELPHLIRFREAVARCIKIKGDFLGFGPPGTGKTVAAVTLWRSPLSPVYGTSLYYSVGSEKNGYRQTMDLLTTIADKTTTRREIYSQSRSANTRLLAQRVLSLDINTLIIDQAEEAEDDFIHDLFAAKQQCALSGKAVSIVVLVRSTDAQKHGFSFEETSRFTMRFQFAALEEQDVCSLFEFWFKNFASTAAKFDRKDAAAGRLLETVTTALRGNINFITKFAALHTVALEQNSWVVDDLLKELPYINGLDPNLNLQLELELGKTSTRKSNG